MSFVKIVKDSGKRGYVAKNDVTISFKLQRNSGGSPAIDIYFPINLLQIMQWDQNSFVSISFGSGEDTGCILIQKEESKADNAYKLTRNGASTNRLRISASLGRIDKLKVLCKGFKNETCDFEISGNKLYLYPTSLKYVFKK